MASPCTRCARTITGDSRDVKVIDCPDDGPAAIYCLACARIELGPEAFMVPPWFYVTQERRTGT